MSQLIVLDAAGHRLPAITIRISDGTAPQEAATYDVTGKWDGSYGWPIPGWDDRLRTLYANVGDYADPAFGADQHTSLETDGEGNIVFTLPASGTAGPGLGQESGPLDTYFGGRLEYGFKDDQGQPWFMAAYTTHLMPSVIAKGEDIRPVFREAIGYGANTLMPICTHRSQWKKDNGWFFDPLADEGKFQQVMATMCDVAVEMQVRLAPAILADVQDMDTAHQQRIVDLACEVFAGRWNVLPRKGNECGANGYDPTRISMRKVRDMLWSHGSYGENTPPYFAGSDPDGVPHNGARWGEWQSRRGYTDAYHKVMDDCGAGILELNKGYTGSDGRTIGPFDSPVVGIEMPYFADTDLDHVGDRRWTDPKAALQIGLELGANAAGMGVGTSLGLECKPNGPLAADCARQQFRGARAAFLR